MRTVTQLIIVVKRITYVGINFTIEVNELYTEN